MGSGAQSIFQRVLHPAGDKGAGQVSSASKVSGRPRVTRTQMHRQERESAHSSCHGEESQGRAQVQGTPE